MAKSSYLSIFLIVLVVTAGAFFAWRLEKSNLEIKRLEREKTGLAAAKADLAQEIDALKADATVREREIRNVGDKLHGLETLTKEQERKHALKATEAENFAKSVREKDKRIKELETSLRHVQKDLQTKIDRREEAIGNLRDETGELTGLKEDLERKYGEKVDEIAQLERGLKEREESMEELAKRIEEIERTFREREKGKDSLINDLTEQQRVLQSHLGRIQEENERLDKTIKHQAKEFRTKVKELTQSSMNLHQENESLRIEIEAAKARAGQARAEKDRLVVELQTVQTRLTDLAGLKKTSDEQLREKEKALNEMTVVQQRLREQMRKAEDDKVRLGRILESQKKEGDEHELIASELRRVNQELESQIDSLSTQLQTTQTRFQELETEKNRLAREITAISVSTEELEKSRQQAQRSLEIKDQIIRSLQTEIAAGQLTIVQLADRTTIRLEEKIFFDSGKAVIKPSGLAMLDKIGKTLKQIQDRHIQVEGHTDSRPLRWQLREKYPTNWELSAARAAVIVRYLVNTGGIDPTRISAAGYASYRAVESNTTAKGQQRNRRVEFALLPLDDINPN